MLRTEYEALELRLENPFRISRSSTGSTRRFHVVRVTDEDGNTGVGAAAPSRYHGETPETVEGVLPELLEAVEGIENPARLAAAEKRMKNAVGGNPAARASVSVALHDLVSKRLGVPLYSLLGLEPEAPETSLTLGIAPVDEMVERARAAYDEGFGILKIKLGTGRQGEDRDVETVEAIRSELPEATLRVDANGAWTPHETVEKSDALAENGVEFVEQPYSPEVDTEKAQYVHRNSSLPVALDEPCSTASDVARLAEFADVVNLKLMKSGGIREARRFVSAARAHDLEVMVGCMVETNASLAASVHLSPLADYADLDGSLLLEDDPYSGVPLEGTGFRLEEVDEGTGARIDR